MHRIDGNLRTVEGLFDGLAHNDIDKALSELADDAAWTCPREEPHYGKAAIKELLGQMKATHPHGVHFHDLTLHATPDRVFAEYTPSSEADRKHDELHRLTVFELQFGKVTSVREFTS